MLTTLLAGFASCSNEEPQGTTPKGGQALSFEFAAPRDPFVTRAIATDLEWNVATLDVYTSDGSGVVTKLTDVTDYAIQEPLNPQLQQKYTLTMSDTWVQNNSGQDVFFYFVANAATAGIAAPATLNLSSHAAFLQSLTKELGTANGMQVMYKTDGAATNMLMTDMNKVTVGVESTIEGVLTRRVARFDVENIEAATDADDAFQVTKILIADAANRGYVFSDADPTNIATDVKHWNHAQINGLDNATAYTLKSASDLTVAPVGEGTLAPQVFYLYPTEIGPNAGDTQILVYGKSGDDGNEVVLPITSSALVEANHRYILRVNVTSLTVDLLKADYEEGVIVKAPAGPRSNLVAPTVVADVTGIDAGTLTGNWDFDGTDAQLDITAAGGSVVKLTITSRYGTAFAQADGDDAAGVHVVKAAPVFDRTTYEVTDVYTITVDAAATDLNAAITLFGWEDKDAGKKLIKIVRPL